MKRILPVAILIFLMITTIPVSSQCKSFAKKICKLELNPFIHDGNYHAAILTEGEEAELYKTFYEGQEYRIAVCGSEIFPGVEFRVLDANKKVLYNNREHGMSKTWDFKLESSQQLKIVVQVPVSSATKPETELLSGCVAIMFGFKDHE
jgi:hypothetical protein